MVLHSSDYGYISYFQYYFQFTIGCIVPRMSTDGVQFLNCSVVSRNNKQMLCLDEFIY